jgi:Ni,Fe-hydrogenase I large subunit
MDVDATTTSGGIVNDVKNKVVMFRGLENVMIGRDPRDAPILAPRT